MSLCECMESYKRARVRKYDDGDRWNEDTVYALGYFRTLASSLGFWPTNNRLLSAIKIGLITIIELPLAIIFIISILTYGNCGSLSDIVGALSIIVSTPLAILKVLMPWIQRDHLGIIVKSAVNDWSKVDDNSSKKIMMKYAKIGRNVLIIELVGAYMTVIPSVIAKHPSNLNLISENVNDTTLPLLRNIPIGPSCWVSLEIPLYQYLIYYIYVTIHMLVLASAYVGGDIFIFGIAMHVCGQFENLNNNIKNINNQNNYNQQNKFLKKIIKRHNHLIKLCNEFELVCNVIIFFEIVANMFIICVSGIVLIMAIKIVDTEAIIIMTLRIFVTQFQIFMYCYIGDDLSLKSKNIQIAIYDCLWYNMDSKIIKNLKFIMMRNNYTFNLTAGKIYNMNISNFQNLSKSIFQYFSILRLMIE
uniref:Odorant receptor n=1 Tax=Aphidius gifuensis TaxID=684658 RepID=A0A3Q9EJU2_APHGI|nr:odorant receptor [Aphidius gifuensis]